MPVTSFMRYYCKNLQEFIPHSTVRVYNSNNIAIKSAPSFPANKKNLKITKASNGKDNHNVSASTKGKSTRVYKLGDNISSGNSLTDTNIHNTTYINIQDKCDNKNKAIEQMNVASNEYYENETKIQMISKNLHQQIFPNHTRKTHTSVNINASKYNEELQRFGIDTKLSERLKDVNIKLPKLKGDNIVEHFHAIAEEQLKPYRDLLMPLVELESLPQKPCKWVYEKGWTKYDSETGAYHSVEFPTEDCLVFDVEVCMSEGPLPTLAIAASTKCWYSWVSPRLVGEVQTKTDDESKFALYTTDELIPLNVRHSPKLIIGHNVSYDRARLQQQYLLEDNGTRFLDTMSLHTCVSGITSYQRAMLKSNKEPAAEDLDWLSQSSLNSLADVHRLYCDGQLLSKDDRNIFVQGNLDDIRANFQNLMTYCSNDVTATHRVLHRLFPLFVERFPHPVTLVGMLELSVAYLPVNKNWWRYINESDLAYEELNIESRYHLASRANEACALMNDEQYKRNLWLWDEDWSTQTIKLKQSKTKSTKRKSTITSNDDIASENSLTSEEKRLYKKFQYLHDIGFQIPKRRPLLPGYPAWYRKLCSKPPEKLDENSNWQVGPTAISTGMQIAPKLLSLCWEGYPLHYRREQGWGFLVPFRTEHTELETITRDPSQPRIPIEELSAKCPQSIISNSAEQEFSYSLNMLQNELNKKLGKREFYSKAKKKNHTSNHLYKGSGVWCNQILEDCCYFMKLPHKNGKSLPVGNPLARDFLNKFYENVLTSGESASNAASRIIDIARMMSYWRNNRERIIGQLVIWLSSEQMPNTLKNLKDYEYGAICPQVVTCGTLTRRAVEPTWMTASNSQEERIGSELRAMIQAPPNYRIVGADVDSQELWIASILGDAYACGTHGSTPFGWMTISGTKACGTDMHSVTAKAVGISRDHAKIINYARIYGAGQNFAEDLLKQFNPSFSDAEARSKALKMFAITKGKRIYKLKDEYHQEYEKKRYTWREALAIASATNRGANEIFDGPIWEGGTESAMFNSLEEIATTDQPVTPFLECRLSRALETNDSKEKGIDRFLPTRINWVVQSGAVDFLHLMLVCMRWLLEGKARFCLSFHDEIRYLVEEEYAYKAALALHVTNLLTRSFCSARLRINDLPMSVAFFSSVEVDTVLRKESTMLCKTPSNPHGLQTGYGIPPGESLSIHEAIEKCGGNDLSQWNWIQ